MKKSEAILKVGLALEGIHEVGFNNRGPQIEEIQKADDLPGGGYAWCVSFIQFVADLLGIKLPSETASVGILENAYRNKGWMVNKPEPGSQGFWRLDGDNWPDHLITVEKVVRETPSYWILDTIEGNTSKGFGSIDDGGGAYRRRRIIPKSAITWGTVPGVMKAETVEKTVAAIEQARKDGKIVSLPLITRLRLKVPTRKPPEEALYWLWLRWYLGEGEFKNAGPRNKEKRPKVLPRRVPAKWWIRHKKFVEGRKK